MRALFFFMAIMMLVNSVGCYTNHGQGPMEPVNLIPAMSKLTFDLPTIVMPIMHKISLNPNDDDLMSYDDEFLNLSSFTFRDIFNNTSKNWTVAA